LQPCGAEVAKGRQDIGVKDGDCSDKGSVYKPGWPC
jgi:hypothetical protein